MLQAKANSYKSSGSLYRAGFALLDLDEPWRIIRRSDQWVFGPHEPYERVGDIPGVTFPTGVVFYEDSGQLHIYYGAADTSVCMASANLDDLLSYLLACPNPNEGCVLW